MYVQNLSVIIGSLNLDFLIEGVWLQFVIYASFIYVSHVFID